MINVSNEFRELMKQKTDFHENAEITFTDGTVMLLTEADFSISNNSVVDGTGVNCFPIGQAIERTVQIELWNDDDHLSNYDFFGAKVRLYLTFALSETTEKIEYGTFTVTTPETYGETVIITAVDNMYKADKTYATSLTFPTSAAALLRDICSKCNILLKTETFKNDNMIIQAVPDDVTCRELIGYIAMLAIGNARIHRDGQLEILSYDFSDTVIIETMADTPTNPHILDSWNSLTLDTDNIIITGIKVIFSDDETSNETEILNGEEGYVISIENPLIFGQAQASQVAQSAGDILINTSFRKFDGDHIANPTLEFGDTVCIIDRKQKRYFSFITDINFVFFGFTTVSNSSEDTVRNNSRYSSNANSAFIKSRELIEHEKTLRENAIEQLNYLLSISSGLYVTADTQPDGSSIYYMHNKQTLEESDIVWKMTSEAIGISTDGGKTYPYGLDVSGVAILRKIYTIGLNANYINTGAITVKDDNENVLFKADIANKTVELSGWDVTQNSIVSKDKSTLLEASYIAPLTTYKWLTDNGYTNKSLTKYTYAEIKHLNSKTYGKSRIVSVSNQNDYTNGTYIALQDGRLEIYENDNRIGLLSSKILNFDIASINTNAYSTSTGGCGLTFTLDSDCTYFKVNSYKGLSTRTPLQYTRNDNTLDLTADTLNIRAKTDFHNYQIVNSYIYDGKFVGDSFDIYNDVDVNFYAELDMHNYHIVNTFIENVSDERLKKNIKDCEINALQIINDIKTVQFDWRVLNTHEDIGFIAQQVGAVDKTLQGIHKDANNEEYYTVNESRLIRYLVKAVQELTDKVTQLSKELEELRNGNNK